MSGFHSSLLVFTVCLGWEEGEWVDGIDPIKIILDFWNFLYLQSPYDDPRYWDSNLIKKVTPLAEQISTIVIEIMLDSSEAVIARWLHYWVDARFDCTHCTPRNTSLHWTTSWQLNQETFVNEASYNLTSKFVIFSFKLDIVSISSRVTITKVSWRV